MSIVRAARKSQFYMLPASVIEDKRLSWAGRGMLVYLLSKPDHWRVQIKDLINQTKEAIGGRSGRDKVYKLINELRAAGYLYQEFTREGGTFRGVEYEVSETPDLEQAARYVASLAVKSEERGQPDLELPFPELPETVTPDTATPVPANPETLDKTERAFQIEKAEKNTVAQLVPVELGADSVEGLTAGQPDNYPANPSGKTHDAWQVYAVAHHIRHKEWPVYNKTVGSLMGKIVDRIGDKAPLAAQYYVRKENAHQIVTSCHPLSVLLKDCEAYATKSIKARRVELNEARAHRPAPVIVDIPSQFIAPKTPKVPSAAASAGLASLRGRKAQGASA